MTFGFGMGFPRGSSAAVGNPFAQIGPTLDLVFAGVATNPTDPYAYTLNANFIVPQYQIAVNYSVLETGVGLVSKNFSDIVTFSRGTNATYTDSTGTIQYAQANMLQYSEQFDNAVWTKGVGVVVTADTTVAPDSTTTGDTILAATISTGVLQTITVPIGIQYTQSIYIKSGGATPATSLMFRDDTGAGRHIVVNPATGVVTSTSGTLISSGSVSVGNGWYRIYFSYLSDTTGVRGFIRVDSVGTNQTFFVWGAQTNPGALQPYNATTATAYYGPRFDYNPSTLVALGLLIEEARTNSIRNNTGVGAVVGSPGTLPTGVAVFSANGLTTAVSAVGTTAGINYVDLRFSGTTTSTFYVLSFDNVAATASSGQVWTETFWCALVGGSTTNVSSFAVDLRQVGGAGGTFDVVFTPTTTLTRVASSGTMTVGTTGTYGAFVMTFASGVAIDVTLRFGLPQLELGAFATSVIPTASVATTRSADLAAVNTLSPWYNAAAGTFVAKFDKLANASSTRVLTASLGTNVNQIRINTTVATNIRLDWQIINSTVIQANVLGTVVVAPNVLAAVAGTYTANYFQQATNTSLGVAVTSGTVPTVSQLNLGANEGGGGILSGHIARITYYPRRMSNAELQIVTNLGA